MSSYEEQKTFHIDIVYQQQIPPGFKGAKETGTVWKWLFKAASSTNPEATKILDVLSV